MDFRTNWIGSVQLQHIRSKSAWVLHYIDLSLWRTSAHKTSFSRPLCAQNHLSFDLKFDVRLNLTKQLQYMRSKSASDLESIALSPWRRSAHKTSYIRPLCAQNRPSFDLKFWQNKWIFGQTEYELHNYNMSGVNQYKFWNP